MITTKVRPSFKIFNVSPFTSVRIQHAPRFYSTDNTNAQSVQHVGS